MKRKIISISVIAIVVAAAGIAFADMMKDEYVPYSGPLSYEPSDITKADPSFAISPSSASWRTTDISEAKSTVLATFRGTVVDIGKPIDWQDNVNLTHGAIPITISVTENTKDTERNDYKDGELFTFYVDSSKIGGKYYIASHEPEFEVGEDVVVHIAKSRLGPLGEGGDNYFVELGDFGKYKIQHDKAFNEKFHNGKSIRSALNESR